MNDRWVRVIAICLVALWAAPLVTGASDLEPTLDELLELPVTDPNRVPRSDPGASDRMDDDGNPIALFDQAVGDMQEAAARLSRMKDPGVRTQRLQKSIMAKLDQLIKIAQAQQGSSGGSGGMSGKPRRTSRSAAGQAAGLPVAGGVQPSQGAAGAGSPSGVQQRGQDPGALDENRRGWGQLPPRLRDELQQGVQEPFSPVYQRLTEQYYKRLAEQGRERE